MTTMLTRDGSTIRVAWLIPWSARLFALPLLAVSAYFLYVALMIVKDDASGASRWSDDAVGLLVLFLLALAIGLPGLIIATFRYHVAVDKLLRQVTVTRQFGPLQFRRPRALDDFRLVTITRDADDSGRTRGSTYNVNLGARKGLRPVVLSGFTRREDANDLAHELGGALRLPIEDLADTAPDDPDLESDTGNKAASSSLHRKRPPTATSSTERR